MVKQVGKAVLYALGAVVLAICSTWPIASANAGAADFVSLCEANQVYDTGKQTTDTERDICRCIEHRLDPTREQVAIQVFQKVLAARRKGQGLHPSQIELEELVALMTFADDLRTCSDKVRPGRAAF